MKKSKILIVSVLAVVLCIMCTTSMTFSWFTRPRTDSGNKLLLPAKTYDISNGNAVQFTTYESSDNGVSYETEVTNFAGTASIAPGKRKMYRTDVINGSSVPQSVSLFLSQLSIPSETSGQFYLGVNNPLKTFKPYGTNAVNNDSKEEVYVNKRNIYVGFVDNVTYTPGNFYIHYWNDSIGLMGDSTVSSTKLGVGNYTVKSNYSHDYNMYCATIPYEANALCLMTGSNAVPGGNNITLDTLNTVVWFHYDGSYQVEYKMSGVSAGIKNFYSSAKVKVGNTINLAATGQGTITYSSSNSSVARVNSSGVVTGVGKGTATITATSKGVYGDVVTSSCEVTVYDGSSNAIDLVPVVTNVKVDAATAEGATTKSIYWYIKNNSETATLTYTLSGLDLTL